MCILPAAPRVKRQKAGFADNQWGVCDRQMGGPMGQRRKRLLDGHEPATRYRVWIAAYHDWQPAGCQDVPPQAVALEPAEDRTMSARQARRYVAAFNRVALSQGRRLWAVALPVAVRYEGDPQPGQLLKSLGVLTDGVHPLT